MKEDDQKQRGIEKKKGVERKNSNKHKKYGKMLIFNIIKAFIL